MSWESSIKYYRVINQAIRDRKGGSHSAKSLMYSVDFAEIEGFQEEGRWVEATQCIIDAAQALERGGADFLVICTNTMHKNADEVQNQINIPILHIADATAEVIKAKGLHTVGLLGTRYTMEEDFYKGRLERKYGLEILVPEEEDRETVHRIIYNELVCGEIREASRSDFRRIIDSLVKRGARGIILGCTEIGLLVQASDSVLPLFDTTRIHAEAAVEFALAE
jgi:aspartate racemase